MRVNSRVTRSFWFKHIQTLPDSLSPALPPSIVRVVVMLLRSQAMVIALQLRAVCDSFTFGPPLLPVVRHTVLRSTTVPGSGKILPGREPRAVRVHAWSLGSAGACKQPVLSEEQAQQTGASRSTKKQLNTLWFLSS